MSQSPTQSQQSSQSSTPSASTAVRLDDPDLDCPNPKCCGFLSLYGYDPLIPTFLQCSEKNSQNGCQQTTMFARKDGKCSICKLNISKVC